MDMQAAVMDLSGLLNAKNIGRYVEHHMYTQNVGGQIDTINFTSGPRKHMSLMEVEQALSGLAPPSNGMLNINAINFPYISASTTIDASETIAHSSRLNIKIIQMKLKKLSLCFYLSRLMQSLLHHKWLAIGELQIVVDPVPSSSYKSLHQCFVLDEEPLNLSQTKVRIILTTNDEPLQHCRDALPSLGNGIEVDVKEVDNNESASNGHHHKVFLLAEAMEQPSPDEPGEQSTSHSDQLALNRGNTNSATLSGGQSIPVRVQRDDDPPSSSSSSSDSDDPNIIPVTVQRGNDLCSVSNSSSDQVSHATTGEANVQHVHESHAASKSTSCSTSSSTREFENENHSNSGGSISIPIRVQHSDARGSSSSRRQPVLDTEHPSVPLEKHGVGKSIPIKIIRDDTPHSMSTTSRELEIDSDSTSSRCASIPIKVQHSDDQGSMSSSSRRQPVIVTEHSNVPLGKHGVSKSIPISHSYDNILRSMSSTTRKRDVDSNPTSSKRAFISSGVQHSDDNGSTSGSIRTQPILISEQPNEHLESQGASKSIPITITHDDTPRSMSSSARELDSRSTSSKCISVPIQVQDGNDREPMSSSIQGQPVLVNEQTNVSLGNRDVSKSIPISNASDGTPCSVSSTTRQRRIDSHSSSDRYISVPIRVQQGNDHGTKSGSVEVQPALVSDQPNIPIMVAHDDAPHSMLSNTQEEADSHSTSSGSVSLSPIEALHNDHGATSGGHPVPLTTEQHNTQSNRCFRSDEPNAIPVRVQHGNEHSSVCSSTSGHRSHDTWQNDLQSECKSIPITIPQGAVPCSISSMTRVQPVSEHVSQHVSHSTFSECPATPSLAQCTENHTSGSKSLRVQPVHDTECNNPEFNSCFNPSRDDYVPVTVQSSGSTSSSTSSHITEQANLQLSTHASTDSCKSVLYDKGSDSPSSTRADLPLQVTEQVNEKDGSCSNSGECNLLSIRAQRGNSHGSDFSSTGEQVLQDKQLTTMQVNDHTKSNACNSVAIKVKIQNDTKLVSRDQYAEELSSSLGNDSSSGSGGVKSIPIRHRHKDHLLVNPSSTKDASGNDKLQSDRNDRSTVDQSTPLRQDHFRKENRKRRGSCPSLSGNQPNQSENKSENKSEQTRLIPIKHEPHPVTSMVMFNRLWLPERDSLPTLDNLFECGITGDGVAVAVLGLGCDITDKAMFRGEVPSMDGTCSKVFTTQNFVSDTSPIFDASNKATLISYIAVGSAVAFPMAGDRMLYHGIAPGSALIVCKTAREDGAIADGATSRAIDWLTDQWTSPESMWKSKFAGLVVLISYGGHYMEDEMRAIHRATDNSIIVICAGGMKDKDVAFPAALGNVISIGSKNGPTGREVDFSASEPIVSTVQVVKRTDLTEIMGLLSTGVDYSFHSKTLRASGTALAAAVAAGITSLLISYIMQALKSNSKDDPTHKQIKSVLLKRLSKGYLHTCVIRELLMEVGSGHHDNKLGYGMMNTKIFELEEEQLLVKLANIISRDLPEIPGASSSAGEGKLNEITDKTRQAIYHGLMGNGITAAVIDDDFPADGPITISPEVKQSHGYDCAQVLLHVAPMCRCIAINDSSDDFSEGFHTCVENYNADIISFSGAIDSFSPELSRAISKAIAAGIIVVCAAGNEGQVVRNTLSYPGRIGNVLCIGGRDRYHRQLPFSSSGKELDFLAPAIFRSGPGTSLAAPTIAGFIALLLQFVKEEMSAGEVEAWAKNPQNDSWEWRKIPIFQACRNVYAMRALLRTLVPKPQDHSEAIGFGCIDISVIFQSFDRLIKPLVTSAAKKHIFSTIQNFYKGEY